MQNLNSPREFLQPQLKPMQDTSIRKKKNRDNIMQGITNIQNLNSPRESLQPQLEPMQDTSIKKKKSRDNTMQDITDMEPEIHDAKTMLQEIIMETSS